MKKVGSGSAIAGWIFFIIGAIMTVAALLMYKYDTDFKKTALTTNSTIIEIKTYTDSDGDTSHEVFVEYYVEGKKYDGKLGYYTSAMDVGDSVTIYYDPNNPQKFLGSGSATVLIILLIIGSIFTLVGLIFLIYDIKEKGKKRRLLKLNYIINANIVSFEVNKSIRVNSKHPYELIATAISPYDGLVYTFKSESIMNDLSTIFQDYKITTVPVYVNPQNYKEYYVDIDYFKRYLSK